MRRLGLVVAVWFGISAAGVACGADTPKAGPPFTHHTIDVSIDGGDGDVTIGGSLTLPEGAGPHPAVVLITGGGKQDRDQSIGPHRPFRVIAEALAEQGYAVLRTDDRGVGSTTGDKDSAGFDDLGSDAIAEIDFLGARSDIDERRIGLLGHSQGGYLGPLVAQAVPDDVAFVMLLAGPAQTGCDVLKHQLRVQLSGRFAPDYIRAGERNTDAICERLRDDDFAGARESARAENNRFPVDQRASEADVDASVNEAYAALATYDPAPALRSLRVPVLALFGTKDVQVDAAVNAPLMRRLLSGNPAATVHTFTGVNHLMQQADSGMPEEYTRIPAAIDPGVLDYVVRWLGRVDRAV